MKRAIFAVVAVLFLFFGAISAPGFVVAQTETQSEEARVKELQAMVVQLLSLIADLQRQLLVKQGIAVNSVETAVSPTLPSCARVEVVWNKVGGANEYVLYRNGTEIYAGKEVRFVDAGLRPGTTYQYTVRARNAGGLGAASVVKTITTPAVCAPGAPAVTAVPGQCGGVLFVSWERVPIASFYEVFRGDTKIFSGIVTSVTDRELQAGKGYTYKVRAGNSGGLGGFSAGVTANASVVCPPGAPQISNIGAPSVGKIEPNEGRFAVWVNTSPSGVTVESGKSGAAVLDISAQAKDSSIIVDRIDIEFSDRVWLFLSAVQIKEGSRVVASKGAGEGEFSQVGDNTYRMSFSGLGIGVAKDKTKKISVAVIAKPGLALATPRAIIVSIPLNSIRARDQLGITHAGPAGGQLSKQFFVRRQIIKP